MLLQAAASGQKSDYDQSVKPGDYLVLFTCLAAILIAILLTVIVAIGHH